MRPIKYNYLRAISLFFSLFLVLHFIVDVLFFKNTTFCFFSLYEGAVSFLFNQILKNSIVFICLFTLIFFFKSQLLKKNKLNGYALIILIILEMIANVNTMRLCLDSIYPFLFFNSVFSISFILSYNLYYDKKISQYLSGIALISFLMIYFFVPRHLPKIGFHLSSTTENITLKNILANKL